MTISYITYTEDPGQIYIDEINYTGNQSGSVSEPQNYVKFKYDAAQSFTSCTIGSSVVTAKKLSEILCYTVNDSGNDLLSRKYILGYDTSPYSNKRRLKTIEQHDNTGNTLPIIEFDYHGGSILAFGFGNNSELTVAGDDPIATNYFVVDVNGDGFSDIVKYLPTGSPLPVSYKLETYLSNGDGDFRSPVETQLAGPVSSIQFGEANGDGLTDIISLSPVTCYFPSNGDGSFGDRIALVATGGSFLGSDNLYIVDVNGDGLSDIVKYRETGSFLPVSYILETYLSNGDGNFRGPVETQLTGSLSSIRFGEANGDGLTDIIYLSPVITQSCYFPSNGDGSFGGSTTLVATGGSLFGPDNFYIVDVNGDGLSDIVKYLKTESPLPVSYKLETYLANGDGDFRGPFGTILTGPLSSIRCGEINGDGLTDIISNTSLTSTTPVYFPNQWNYPDLLKSVDNGRGSTTTFNEYLPSTKYTNKFLPIILQTIKSITVSDGDSTTLDATTTFDYEGGDYAVVADDWYNSREFRGFERVIQKNPDYSTIVETTFHQDEFRRGKIDIIDYKASNGTLLFTTDLSWSSGFLDFPDLSWSWVSLSTKNTAYYDEAGIDVVAEKDESYTYWNTHGSLKTKFTSGTGGEDITAYYEYENCDAPNGYLYRVNLKRLSGSESGTVRETKYTVYDINGNYVYKEQLDQYGGSGVYLSTEYGYDSYGNIDMIIDPENLKTNISYDTVTQTYPCKIAKDPFGLNHFVQYEYDNRFGKVKKATDVNTQVTDYLYDGFGRLVQIDYPDGGQVINDYSELDKAFNPQNQDYRYIHSYIKESGNSFMGKRKYFDGLNRPLITITDGENTNTVVRKNYYDVLGRVERTEGPYLRSNYDYVPSAIDYKWTIITYDDLNRPREIRGPINGTITHNGSSLVSTKYEYDGYETIITDPDNKKKKETRDYLGRIIEVTEDPDGFGYRTEYNYNAADDLLSIKKYDSGLIYKNTITYNTLGLKRSIADPDMGDWTYTYDNVGNLKTQTDANGNVSTHSYDILHRLKTKSYSTPQPKAIYKYDLATYGVGRLYQGCVDANNNDTCDSNEITTTYNSYDKMGREKLITKSIDSNNYGTFFEYDLSGKIKTMTYPDPTASANSYLGDAIEHIPFSGAGLIQKVVPFGAVNWYYAKFEDYEPTGKIGQMYCGNGTTSKVYTYDAYSSRLVGYNCIRNYGGTGINLQIREYKYSPAGDIMEIKDLMPNGLTYSYTYDNLHRLESEVSNSTEVISGVFTINHTYTDIGADDGPLHAFKTSTLNDGTTTQFLYSADNFDHNGNMLKVPDFTDPSNPATRTIQYNTENMPTTINHTTQGPTTIEYDAEGKRVKKTHGGNVTYYIGNYYEVINGVQTSYIFAGNTRVAMINNTGVYYYQKDHLGSTNIVTDSTGIPEGSETQFLPFGLERNSDGQAVSNYKFTDQEQDTSTGLYNYNARLYDPGIRMFISPDSIVPYPYDPQSLNRYAYCLNNPIRYIDPSGHKSRRSRKNQGEYYGDPYNSRSVAASMALITGKTNHSTYTEAQNNPECQKAYGDFIYKGGITLGLMAFATVFGTAAIVDAFGPTAPTTNLGVLLAAADRMTNGAISDMLDEFTEPAEEFIYDETQKMYEKMKKKLDELENELQRLDIEYLYNNPPANSTNSTNSDETKSKNSGGGGYDYDLEGVPNDNSDQYKGHCSNPQPTGR